MEIIHCLKGAIMHLNFFLFSVSISQIALISFAIVVVIAVIMVTILIIIRIRRGQGSLYSSNLCMVFGDSILPLHMHIYL